MLNVMACLNEAEILGSIIDPETHIDMVLASLNDFFSQFKLDYDLNHKEYTLMTLMHDLQRAEGIIKGKQGKGHLVHAFISRSTHTFQKGKKKGRKGKKKPNANAIPKKVLMKKYSKPNVITSLY
ncbi:hypothetical protein Patl1_37005 [Pistacia atlantica]|nr:hypothetical protein Patl1_37005 [Pistacia atlantica]